MSLVDALRVVGITASHVDRGYMYGAEERCFIDGDDEVVARCTDVSRQALVDLLVSTGVQKMADFLEH